MNRKRQGLLIIMSTSTAKRRDHSQMTDGELIAAVRGGDGSAFRTIMQRHNQRLYRVARGIVRDESEAEDVLQESYVRAYAALPSFRSEASLGTWLTRIVINEATGRLRRRRTAETLDVLEQSTPSGDARVVLFPGLDQNPNPEMAAAHAEIRRLLEHAIDGLPDSFRLVFVMRDIEDMSIEETAANLDIRPETVKTRLHRARKLLRQNLDEKLAGVLRDTFPFLGARCARITDLVAARLALEDRSERE